MVMAGPLLITFTSLIGLGLVYALLPFQAMSFGAGPFLVTALLATDTLAIVLSAPLLGRMSDRWGRRPVILFALACGPIAYGLMAMADGLALLFLSRLFAGIANAGVSVIQAYLADRTDETQRSGAMAGINACFGLAFVAGPLIALATLGEGARDFASPALWAMACSIVSWILAWRLLERIGSGRSALPRAIECCGTTKPGPETGFTFALPLAGLIALAFVYEAQVTTVGLWGEVLLQWTARENSIAFMAAGAAAAFAWPVLLLSPLRKLDDALLAAFASGLLGAGLTIFSGLIGTPSSGIAIAAMSVNGFAILLGLSALQGLMSKATPESLQGQVFGLSHALASLARILGPLWAGLAFGHLGPGWPALSGVLILICGLGLFTQYRKVAALNAPTGDAVGPRR